MQSRDIRGRLILLGTGTSVGVPVIGCDCAVCTGGQPRNQRTRSAAILGLPAGNLLIDTPPDLRFQLLRERVGLVHAVLFTHAHADHIFGLDDLRLIPFYLGHAVPLYAEPPVVACLERTFAYAFDKQPPTHPGAVPQFEMHRIGLAAEAILDAAVQPIRLRHGPRFEVLGFRFGRVAYCTDTNEIPPESVRLLEGLDVLILDALRPRPHPTHFGLDEAIEVARQLKPRQTYFTHVSHELDHDTTNARLPNGMQLAYDGLEIPLT